MPEAEISVATVDFQVLVNKSSHPSAEEQGPRLDFASHET